MIPVIPILSDISQQSNSNAPSLWEILSFLGSIASIVSLLLMYRKGLLDKLLPYRWRKKYRESITEDLRKNYLKNKIYIQPYITTTPPQSSDEPDKINLENKKLLRDYFINEVFIKEPNESDTVFFLFGDTGTGKTATLVHLFIDYIKKHNAFNLPFQIRLISLRESDAIKDITNIPKTEKEKLILLLDAMDENPEVNDPTQLDSFLKKLKAIFHDFARIVITCRPQFFPDNIRQEIITNPKGIRTSTGWIECSIRYLAPFDDQQVQDYLDQAITFRSENPRRRKAEDIVNMHPAIAIRPLVLTYINKLVNTERLINTTLDLFDNIIYSILNRDISKSLGLKDNKDKIKQWWEVSSLVAKYMYQNNKLTITDTELGTLLPNNIEKLFKQRSLLTRYGNEFHFSHKSFYEYFMAYRFFLHPDEIGQVYGMDFALQLYDELYASYSKQHDVLFADLHTIDVDVVATSLHNIGSSLDVINHFAQAELEYTEALTIRRQLADKNPDAFLPHVAMTLNNLAILHSDTNRHADAEQEYQEALTAYRQLADNNPDAYLPNVAMTLNNLANLHRATNRHAEAEQEYQEALSIRRQLAAKNHDAYLPDVAGTLNNLALLHSDTNRHADAEQEYQEALSIRRQLADKNPDAYLPDVAGTLNNLANLHRATNRHADAEQEYQEALVNYRILADNNPDAYLPDLAMTLNNLAILHYNTNRHADAEQEYQEALTIRRHLADKNPDAYLPDVAMTLNNLAILHYNTNRHADAEQEYQEALTIRRHLAAKNPDAYLPHVAMTLNNLANLHSDTNRHADAEQEYQEALTAYRQLADKNPDAYLPDVAMTLFNIALLHLDKDEKDIPAAEAAAKESLEKYRIMAEKSHAAFDPCVKNAEELLEYIHKMSQ